MIENIVVDGAVYKAKFDELNACQDCAFMYDDEGCKKANAQFDCNRSSISWVINTEQKSKENPQTTDSIVSEIRELLLKRSQTGIAKYGTTLDRKDLKPSEWCQHLLEELLDASGYVLRLKKDLEAIEALTQGKK